MLIHGSCPCRNISFTLTGEHGLREIPASDCGCFFCAEHAGVWTSNRNCSLPVKVKDCTLGSKYACATQTAEFNVCSRGGIVPLLTSKIDDPLYAVVNVNAFDGVDPALPCPVVPNLDGEPLRASRQKNARLHREYP